MPIQKLSQQEVDERKSRAKPDYAAVKSALANVERVKNILDFNKLYALFLASSRKETSYWHFDFTAGSSSSLQQIYQLAKNRCGSCVSASVPQANF